MSDGTRAPEASRSEQAPLPAVDEEAAPADLARPAAEPAAPERLVTVETDRFVAVITSAGGRLKSYQLKHYRTTVDPNSSYQELVLPTADGESPFGLELRGTRTAAPAGAEDPTRGLVTASDSGAAYEVDAPAAIRLNGEEAGDVRLSWHGPHGVVHKNFRFTGNRYDFSVQVGVDQVAGPYREVAVTWEVPKNGKAPGSHELLFDHAVYLAEGEFSNILFHSSDLLEGISFPEPGVKLNGDLSWTAIAGRHFLAAMVPENAADARLWLKEREDIVQAKVLFPIKTGSMWDLRLYVGPKEVAALESVGHRLERTIDLGWFGFIGFPLLWALRFSHSFTGNYGLDIILLTVVIKILFLPLTQKSFETMRAMQKLQPQLAKLREQYKDDQETMNKEMMEMYRRHKVNPFGGCVPMLLQFPVFIGLYQALMNAIELRHAPFALWIDDLSAPDRLGSIPIPFVDPAGIPVLTVLMGASMLAQQWMTPPAGDPAQQRVMMLMPLLFTFVFVNFPSGLVLYWLVNNVLTIAQQYYITRSPAAA
jgi:YidC/Oxa1 family membrane protein insertase